MKERAQKRMTELERLVQQHGCKMRLLPPHQVQVKGSLLVNWYPFSTRCMMYVAGTTKGVQHATAKQVVDAAIGKSLPPLPVQARIKSYQHQKRRMFKFSQVCHWCGCALALEAATVDHKVPLSRGGMNHPNNYVLACAPCNHDKANALPKELGHG